MLRPDSLFAPLTLPCGVTLKNRIVKSAMSDSLGDGTGHPTPAQGQLYARWAQGGLAMALIGEVQGNPAYAEKPGNLVLTPQADLARFQALAAQGASNGAGLWLQLSHAGALSYGPTSTPRGPSALDLPGLKREALSLEQVRALPDAFARTAALAQRAGFGGVELHAAHGFLLSQFLSPFFNHRSDAYGGSSVKRMRLLFEIIDAVRAAVGPHWPIAVKLNATDMLEGGQTQAHTLEVVAALEESSVDLIDISGGTYLPGVRAVSDDTGSGPYFLSFAAQARAISSRPLMLTGGFKTRAQAEAAVLDGPVDVVGLARALVLEPDLPNLWQGADGAGDPVFPRFATPPEGGITAWYTMAISALSEGRAPPATQDLPAVLAAYEARDAARTALWLAHFGSPAG